MVAFVAEKYPATLVVAAPVKFEETPVTVPAAVEEELTDMTLLPAPVAVVLMLAALLVPE